jgi:hypothetical protein
MASKQFLEVTTPAGVAGHVYFLSKDTEGEYASQKFSLQINFPTEADLSAIDEAGKTAAAAEWPDLKPTQLAKVRGAVREDDEGNRFFKATSQFRPTVVDAKKRVIYSGKVHGENVPDEARISPGDVIKVRIALIPNKAGGSANIGRRLLAVQLIERRGSGGGGDYAGAFNEEDGYEAAPAKASAAPKVSADDDADF